MPGHPVCYLDGDGMKHDPAVNDTLEISRWLAAGGRGIDTAWSYDHGGYGRSQRQMGVAIAASKLPRSEIFVTTKIPCADNSTAVAALIEYDLQQLELDSVDLLLIHTPGTCKTPAALAATWAAMEAALAQKQVCSRAAAAAEQCGAARSAH
jgi:2,5-diketo-D-gluconate reductase A